MPIYTKHGKVVVVGGAVAASENCCCPDVFTCEDCSAMLALADTNGLLLTVGGATDFDVTYPRICTNGGFSPSPPSYSWDEIWHYKCSNLNGTYHLTKATLLSSGDLCPPATAYTGPNLWLLKLGDEAGCEGSHGPETFALDYSIPAHSCRNGSTGAWNTATSVSIRTYATCVSCRMWCDGGLLNWTPIVGGESSCLTGSGSLVPSVYDSGSCNLQGGFTSPLGVFCNGGAVYGTGTDFHGHTITFSLQVAP